MLIQFVVIGRYILGRDLTSPGVMKTRPLSGDVATVMWNRADNRLSDPVSLFRTAEI